MFLTQKVRNWNCSDLEHGGGEIEGELKLKGGEFGISEAVVLPVDTKLFW